MYNIRKLDENRTIRAMLWNRERLLHALYELCNRELVEPYSKERLYDAATDQKCVVLI